MTKGKNPLRKSRKLSGYALMPLLMTLLLSVFMTQCKTDDYEGEITGVCPLVILTDPADEAVKVALDKVITATFNEDMDPSTINTTSYVLMDGENAVTGTVTQVSGNKAAYTFTPKSPLKPHTLYTATMKKGVRDPLKNALQKDYVWSFTTIGQHTVALTSSPEAGGTTTGKGLYETDASATIKAVAAEGYTFKNWTEGENIFTSKADTTFIVTENRTLVANFETIKFAVTLSSSPEAGGTTTGGGLYDTGTSVTVKAAPAAEYTFTNWTEGTEIVSTDAEYTFPITSNKTLVANFTTVKYTVALSSNPLFSGTTTGAGSYNSGTSVTVKALPAVGYTFKNWTEGVNIVSTDANYTFPITANKTLVANFTAIPKEYTVALSSNPLLGGSTSGQGSFISGTSITVKAVPATGYTFKNWTEGANIVSTDANYTFSITANRTLVANFEADIVQFNVNLSSNPLNGGTTDGAGSYNSGASVTVKAVPATGYTFKNWTEGANIVSTDANYTFSITANRTLVANFEADIVQFNVNLTSNPLNGGTTDGAGFYNSGASVTVKAVPAVGYTFTNWKEGANIVSTNANYMFNITANRTLVANFTATSPIGPIIPGLGGAGDFSILTKSGISSTGITAVQGNIGVSPAAAAAITGFGLIMDTNGQSSHTTIATHVTGKVYAADYAPPTPSKLTTAISNMETAYTTANNLVTPAPIVNQGAGNISGLTLAPGLYKWSTGVKINSGATVTLSGGPNDTWVFQIAQDLTLDPSSQVKLIGGAQAKNIIWVVAGQAVLNTNTVLFGNIMSKTLISLNTGSKVTGGLFAQTAVTLNTATVNKP